MKTLRKSIFCLWILLYFGCVNGIYASSCLSLPKDMIIQHTKRIACEDDEHDLYECRDFVVKFKDITTRVDKANGYDEVCRAYVSFLQREKSIKYDKDWSQWKERDNNVNSLVKINGKWSVGY